MPWSFWVKHWFSTFYCGESLTGESSTEDIWKLCLQYWPQGIMTLPPLILIHQCIFYTQCSFPWGYRQGFPIPLTIGCIWILPLKQHCGWNLISWSDTAKCLSAFAHKFQNNMKGILEVSNKRKITNTKHLYDIYFQKRECNFSPVVKYLLVCKMLRN